MIIALRKIRAHTKNSLEFALDIISAARSIRHCYAAIGRGGGKYAGMEPLPQYLMATMRKTVKSDWIMGPEVTGMELDLPGDYYRKANPKLYIWFQGYIKQVAALYESGQLKTHPMQVKQGGRRKSLTDLVLCSARRYLPQN